MTVSFRKKIDDVMFRLYTSHEFRALDGELYVWINDRGQTRYLSEEDEREHGVVAYRGMLSNPA